MLFKRPIKVDIITKNKLERSTFWISIFAILVSLGTFIYSIWDLTENRKQDANNFYALNASYLKISIPDSTVFYTSNIHNTELIVAEKVFDKDSFALSIPFNFLNTSSQRCEIIGFYLINSNSVQNDLSNENSILNYIKSSSKQINGKSSIEILPNETFGAIALNVGYYKPIWENFKFKLIVVYRNSIGGHYAMIFNGVINNMYGVGLYHYNKPIYYCKINYSYNGFVVFKEKNFPQLINNIDESNTIPYSELLLRN